MRVMVQENLAFSNHVVNGAIGVVRDIRFEDHGGIRIPVVVYVHIPGSGSVVANTEDDVVPIFPACSKFKWERTPPRNGQPAEIVTVTRMQPPLLPAYCYTDYKAQGRSLHKAIVDVASARTLQGVYVMLSRVRTLDGLSVL